MPPLGRLNVWLFTPRKNVPLIVDQGHSMVTSDAWRVWRDLERKEDHLHWGGYYSGAGQRYDSMGLPASASRNSYGYEQMGRVDRVRKALADSGPLAQTMAARQLSVIDLSSVWTILMVVCEDVALYYGGSVIAGGLIGGIGGAFLGGIGAVPGAAAGAGAGSYVGGAMLSLVGLKSLVVGVIDSVPEALAYYRKGFGEAWGPTREDRLSLFGGRSVRGDPFAAAFYLAQGHVMMITAILSVLLAYATRGKGGKEAALKEISQSPRLGPKVAQWIEQNGDKLRHHPKLRRRNAAGLDHAEPPPPPRRGEPRHEPGKLRPNGMPKKIVPCFKTNGLPQGGVPEFDRQLAGQEAGINNMTVEEYVNGREAFDAKLLVRNRKVARDARCDFCDKMESNLIRELQAKGIPVREAAKQAKEIALEKMTALAALHNPDMVSGGKDVIGDFGDRNINSRIGAQWRKGGRLSELDKAAKAVPEAMRAMTKMNARLERCK